VLSVLQSLEKSGMNINIPKWLTDSVLQKQNDSKRPKVLIWLCESRAREVNITKIKSEVDAKNGSSLICYKSFLFFSYILHVLYAK